MIAPRNGKETPGIAELAKRELLWFFRDPLGYAVERWIQAAFVSVALMILISAMRMALEPILKAFS